MTNTFVNKVDAERRVLAVVNRHTQGAGQLAGLSEAAIDDWHRRTPILALKDVVAQLRESSDLCQRLSDKSHETFQPLDMGLQAAIDKGIDRLERAIAHAFK